MDKEVEEFFKLLYPEYETLTQEEKFKTMNDKMFIGEHKEDIKAMYTTYLSQAKERGEEINEQEALRAVVNSEKADVYFKLLHPEYETSTPKEQSKLMDDKKIIEKHIGQIDEMYNTHISEAESRGEFFINEQEVLKEIIESMNKEEEIQPIDEAKFAEVYDKSKENTKGAFSKIKSIFNRKDNNRDDRTK